MRKSLMLLAGLTLLSSVVMSNVQASSYPFPNLLVIDRFLVMSEVILHSPLSLTQDDQPTLNDEELTTSPPVTNTEGLPESVGPQVTVQDQQQGVREGAAAGRIYVRLRREQRI